MNQELLHKIFKRIQKPSQYLGNEVNVIKKDFDQAKVRVALIFPDKYEIGMSHIGLKVLYQILNDMPGIVCERAFAPDLDMEDELRSNKLPLFSLESHRPLKDFDLIGFSLTYELTFVNMLNIIDLAGLDLWQKNRKDSDPVIIAGGGCMMNAEPVADFLDAACLGDGENVIVDIVNAILKIKEQKKTKAHLLDRLSEIEGVYVPSFFDVQYNNDQTIEKVHPLKKGYDKINKRLVQNLDQAPYPTKTLVSSSKLIHDRIGIEIQRGCNRACRFCQAGYIDRPVRQRSPEKILEIAEQSFRQTGIDEISLLSLSAADYACLVPTLKELNKEYADKKVSISVPATRTEKLTPDLIEQIKTVRKTGFTVAPEAATERMRRVINKGNRVEDLYTAIENAFSAGWDLLKLYYMVGLPFETDDDNKAIAYEANDAIKICLKHSKRSKLNLSCSSFVPKPHTPFQWEPQMSIEECRRRYNNVKHNLESPRIKFKYHHPEMSYIEGILSRGDRRVSQLLYLAFKEGCRFDEWQEHFDYSKWEACFNQWEMNPDFYLHRSRRRDEILPWDHLFAQMDKSFLWEELEKAHDAAYASYDEQGQLLRNQAQSQKQSQIQSEDLQKEEIYHDFGINRRKGLKALDHHDEGFTEDCSVERCSNCGVCDYRQIKNRVYVPSSQELVEKKGHREWYGWEAFGQEIQPSSHNEEEQSQNLKYRFRFYKKDRAAYLGNLELMGVLRRVIRRLDLPVAYSQGFHPQMKLSMGHALSLGIESEWEYFDLELQRNFDTDKLVQFFNQVLPEGLKILEITKLDRGEPSLYSQLTQIEYQIDGLPEKMNQEEIKKAIESFDEADEICLTTKKKGKLKKKNLKDYVSVDKEKFLKDYSFAIHCSTNGSCRVQDAVKGLLKLDDKDLEGLPIRKVALRWKKDQIQLV